MQAVTRMESTNLSMTHTKTPCAHPSMALQPLQVPCNAEQSCKEPSEICPSAAWMEAEHCRTAMEGASWVVGGCLVACWVVGGCWGG